MQASFSKLERSGRVRARGASNPDSRCVRLTQGYGNVALLRFLPLVLPKGRDAVWYGIQKLESMERLRVGFIEIGCKSANCVCKSESRAANSANYMCKQTYCTYKQSPGHTHPITSSYSHLSNDHHAHSLTPWMVQIQGKGVGCIEVM